MTATAFPPSSSNPRKYHEILAEFTNPTPSTHYSAHTSTQLHGRRCLGSMHFLGRIQHRSLVNKLPHLSLSSRFLAADSGFSGGKRIGRGFATARINASSSSITTASKPSTAKTTVRMSTMLAQKQKTTASTLRPQPSSPKTTPKSPQAKPQPMPSPEMIQYLRSNIKAFNSQQTLNVLAECLVINGQIPDEFHGYFHAEIHDGDKEWFLLELLSWIPHPLPKKKQRFGNSPSSGRVPYDTSSQRKLARAISTMIRSERITKEHQEYYQQCLFGGETCPIIIMAMKQVRINARVEDMAVLVTRLIIAFNGELNDVIESLFKEYPSLPSKLDHTEIFAHLIKSSDSNQSIYALATTSELQQTYLRILDQQIHTQLKSYSRQCDSGVYRYPYQFERVKVHLKHAQKFLKALQPEEVNKYPNFTILSKVQPIPWLISERNTLLKSTGNFSLEATKSIDEILHQLVMTEPTHDALKKMVVMKLCEFEETKLGAKGLASLWGIKADKMFNSRGRTFKVSSDTASQQSLPMFKLSSDTQLLWVDSMDALKTLETLVSNAKVTAFDAEWPPVSTSMLQSNEDVASILQIGMLHNEPSTESDTTTSTTEKPSCALIDIYTLSRQPECRKELERVLNIWLTSSIPKISFGGDHDISSLQNSGLTLQKVNTHINLQTRLKTKVTSLASLSETIVGKKLDKTWRISWWHRRPLLNEQIEYAACDVMVLIEAWKVLELANGKNAEVRADEEDVDVGDRIENTN